MFKKLFGICAAILATCGTTLAATPFDTIPIPQRIANAQTKLQAIAKLVEPKTNAANASSSEENIRAAQHWHNHHWDNWRNHWNNWANHWHNHHH